MSMKRAILHGDRRHAIVCVDSGNGAIYECGPEGELVRELTGCGGAFDVWKLPDGSYLYCHIGPDHHGVRLVDGENHVLAEYRCESEVFGCQPLADGGFLVGELTAARLTEVTRGGEIARVIPIKTQAPPHERMRMVRRRPDGTYLVNQPGDRVIRRYDAAGTVLAEIPTCGDTFAVVEDERGHIYYTGQTCIVETDAQGREVWKADAADLKAVRPQWLTGLQLLANGNLLVCNWLGHGCEGQGVPLFEIDRDKAIRWTLEAPDWTRNIANLQVLNEGPGALDRR